MIKSPKPILIAAAALLISAPAFAHDYHRHSKSYVVEEEVIVDAPHTNVQVGKRTGRVVVDAPYTSVRVNPQRRRVRIRAPYVNLNIGW